MTQGNALKNLLTLGIDAGGTETRWALAQAPGDIVAEGQVQGFSALDLEGPGQARVAAILKDLADAVQAHGRPRRTHAGLTGFGGEAGASVAFVAASLGLPAASVTLGSDIETAYLNLFAPGAGYVVYAGTGSIAAFLDPAGVLHRAGGRGLLLDDGGGGAWIAREALRAIWRAEDERPDSWRGSPLAQELFARIGGSEWSQTRQFVYSRERGEMGRLALAVAAAADRDPVARDILTAAGVELARLALALIRRHGPRPVALTGRAATLHALIPEAMRAALPPELPFTLRACRSHHAAAQLAMNQALAAISSPQRAQP